jgi:fluoride ion exporter CrcB/FEX
MKQTIIALLIGITVGLIIGSLATTYLQGSTVPRGYVCVSIRNQSGQNIKSLLLQYNSGSIVTNHLRDKDEVNLTFKNGAEGTYSIVSTFDNETTLTSKEIYVEGGYKTTETIFSDTIKSAYE